MIRLLIRTAGAPQRVVELNKALVRLGRDPSNDVVLLDGYISGHHGEVRIEGGLATYEDLRTTNGTALQRAGRTVPVDERSFRRVVLEDGDVLLLGDTERPVVVEVSLQPARPRAPAAREPARAELDATHAETVGALRSGFDREALIALHAMAMRLTANLELDQVLEVFAVSLLGAFRTANHVVVYLLDESGEFRPALARSRYGQGGFAPISRMVRDRVLACGKAVAFSDATGDLSESLCESSVQFGMCAPLWDGRRACGFVQVDTRGAGGQAFDRSDLSTMVVFAHQAALIIQNARLHAGLRETCERSIRGLVRALEAKDKYTSGHSEEVAELSAAVAEEMGLDAMDVQRVRRAALLHDIGKIGIPYGVLNKTDRLTPEEFRLLKTHPELGVSILEPFGFLSDLIPIVLHHHERWDGRGYPHGVSGEDIPLGARILSAVDTYHALVSDRAYRDSVGDDIALDEIIAHSGTQFDPAVVDVLVRVVEARRVAPESVHPELVPASS